MDKQKGYNKHTLTILRLKTYERFLIDGLKKANYAINIEAFVENTTDEELRRFKSFVRLLKDSGIIESITTAMDNNGVILLVQFTKGRGAIFVEILKLIANRWLKK